MPPRTPQCHTINVIEEECALGLDELPVRLVEMLRERGVRDSDILNALEDGSIHFLAVDQLLGPPSSRISANQIAKATGVEVLVLRRLWRALGFRDFTNDEMVFTELDLQAAHSLKILLGEGELPREIALQLARVMGSSMARFAEAEIVSSSAFGALGDEFGEVDPISLADRFTRYSANVVPAVPQLLVYTWLRHLHAASRRAMLAFDNGAQNVAVVELAIGFVDLVGFTVISQQLSNEELAKVVGRFEQVSFDSVTNAGGRIVKMIGDEVMFVAEDPMAACEIGLRLAAEYRRDSLLSEVRAGIAFGEMLSQDGDYYGPIVNTASRIVNIAAPGTVLITREVADHVRDEGDFVLRALQPRYLKDIGSVELYVIRDSGPTSKVALSSL